MSKELKNILISLILGLSVSAVVMLLFSAVMYLAEIKYEYSSLFATLSVAAGLFVATYYLAYKKKNKGFLTGLISGGLTFLIVLIVSLFVDKGGLTYNSLFHFIIFILSAVIGGVLGVNKATTKKYI